MVVMRALAVACGLFVAATSAAPRTPSDDGEVLERLATKRSDPVRREEDALRASLERDPRDLAVAVRLARLHLGRARSESDPRQLGQAQAALAPWWQAHDPPTEVLLLRATLRQTAHQFEPALSDLRAATAREPRNAQAWLTLATVQQVTGDFAGATASCRRLAPLVPAIVAVTCMAGVAGATGHARESYEALSAVDAGSHASSGIGGWVATLQAELAERLGDALAADRAYRRALAADPTDAYARAAYADFLIDQGRAREVVELIPASTPSDPLLLRYVLAARAMKREGADRDAARLRDRFHASWARGDRVHLREEARFALQVDHDTARALELARANWDVQKEPADARILLEAALAAGQPAAARETAAWLVRTRLESPILARLAAAVDPR